jgi:hypothetical protein
MKHDINGLEKKLRTLNKSLSDLGGQSVSEEFIRIIHGPGWTTPAEFALVNAMADSLQTQVESARSQFQQMMGAAGQIGQH